MPAEPVERVFTTTGVPTHTFVRPVEFDRLTIALRAPGRGAVIEGPSGIGKTTAVTKALEVLGARRSVTALSGRRRDHADRIAALTADGDFGTVVIDDFHRLAEPVQQQVADLLKLLADADEPSRKIVVVGINKAGESLIRFAPDLVNRIDVIPFDVEPEEKVADLVDRGCAALGVRIAARDDIVAEAAGSFCLAQLFCLEACVQAGYLDSAAGPKVIGTPFEPVRRQVLSRQAAHFGPVLRDFARGVTFHPDGRAPFVHLLRWLIDADGWSISLRDELARHPTERAGVRQVVDEGVLRKLTRRTEIAELFYFDPVRCTLSIEDPLLAFYLRNLDWPAFLREVGFANVDHEQEYDVALSFAAEDREFAEFLVAELRELGHAVFYDRSEQYEMLAGGMEDYLGPIYRSGSRYVVVLLGPAYGARRWTMFEASSYRDRIDTGHVIPVRANGMVTDPLHRMSDIGTIVFNPKLSLWPQAKEIAALISRRLTVSRADPLD